MKVDLVVVILGIVAFAGIAGFAVFFIRANDLSKQCDDARTLAGEDRHRANGLAQTAAEAEKAAELAHKEAEEAKAYADKLRQKYAPMVDQEEAIAALKKQREQLAAEVKSKRELWEQEFEATVESLEELTKQVASVADQIEFESFGLYQPIFDLGSSELYKDRIKEVRSRQKEMIKADEATVCSTTWTVDGNVKKGERMVKKTMKLQLRAFNGECDAIINKVRFNNVEKLRERLTKAWTAINKLGESNSCSITSAYRQLKEDELTLSYEFALKKEEEKEEQRRIREQMREEERARKEIERAESEAEAEEHKFEEALAKAKADLEAASEKKQAALRKKMELLEEQLASASDKKAKAISRAQLTKSGHVYVISNIGSFGENIYKIGMTRRLDPLERVKELGDASVPFGFDVHAMMYSEDAPALEAALQKRFAEQQINLVNHRREFFAVSLDEIESAVAEEFGETDFVRTAVAEEWRESEAIRRQREEERRRTAQELQAFEVVQAKGKLEELRAGWRAEPV